MAWKHLGETFDIHGGGIDLVFPHHENEIAQSRCAFHTPLMARTWMHNGFLQVEGEKMAKSVGNFVTIRELLADWPGEVLRFNMLHTHYHQPMDWTVRGLQESMGILDHWYGLAGETQSENPGADFLEALADDLNTPRAISELHGLATQAHRGSSSARGEFAASLRLIGLLQLSNEEWIASTRSVDEIDPKRVEELIAARNDARKAKNFTEADRIRAELRVMRVDVKDNKDGTTSWEVTR